MEAYASVDAGSASAGWAPVLRKDVTAHTPPPTTPSPTTTAPVTTAGRRERRSLERASSLSGPPLPWSRYSGWPSDGGTESDTGSPWWW